MSVTTELTRLVSQTALSHALVVGCCAAALVSLGLSAYGLRRQPMRRRLPLLALRVIGIGAALVLLLQPALRRERRTTMPSRVAVLLDTSASMSLQLHAKPTVSREARAIELARELVQRGADVKDDRVIELFALPGPPRADGGVEAPVVIPPPALGSVTPREPSTRLAEALLALPRATERDLAGVIVLSDGADHGRLGASDTLDDGTRNSLRALGAPIHTVTIGERDVRDLVVGPVAHDDFAFVRTAISFEVQVRALGAEHAGWIGKQVSVVLRRDGVVIATEQAQLAAGEQRVVFKHVPERTGKFVFDVSVAPLPGELTVENNLVRFPLRVVRDRVRVLQVCGRPSWDERFLRSLLKRDPNVDLISFFILRTPNAIEVATNDELALIPFPTDELFRESLHTFDLVVMQNFDYGPYQMGVYLPEIRRYVEEGGALAMLGGELSFDGGGYAGTPIEEVLPVELGVATGRGASAIDPRPVHPKLTPAGRVHPLTALALDVEESARLFDELPALDGVNLVRRARPDATVLAVHPTLVDADHKPLPIISVREVGRGRVLAVGSDSTWRWSFEGSAHAGPRRPYERFWESAIRWLVRDPSLSLLRLEIDRSAASAPTLARVTAVGPDYRPIAGAKVGFALTRIADPAALERAAPPVSAPTDGVTDVRGKLERPLASLGAGAYRLVARAQLGGREIEDEEIFVVEGAGPELADPAARPELMAALAKATDGEARREDQGTAGLRFRAPREVRVAASEDRPLWTSPLVLFIGFGALAAAWWLGRRWGLR